MQKQLPVMLVLFIIFMSLYALNWYVGYGNNFGNIFGDVALTAAERVQAGDIPYRDFWTMYAPGSFYLLALLFTLFGNHYLVSTVAASALCAAAACMCFRLVADLLGRVWPALVCALVFFGATYSAGYYLSLTPYPPTILFVLFALLALVYYYRSAGLAWLVAAGLATGAAIVFKHDVGGYTAMAISAGLLLAHIPRVRHSMGLSLSPIRALLVYASAVALIALPVAIYFAVQAGVDMWQDLIVFPATDFRFTRGEHYPELIPGSFRDEWWLRSVFKFFYYLQFTLPFLMFVAALVAILVAVLKSKLNYVPIAVTFLVAYLFHYGSAHIQINTNVMSLALYGIMLGVIAFDLADRHLKLRGQILLRTGGLALALLLAMAYIAQPLYNRLRNVEESVALSLPKVSGLRVSPDRIEVLSRLVTFVDSNVPEDGRIFIGLHRHDTTVIGDGKMYFVLDRINATRQDQLHPGVVDTAKIQREMIRDLRRHNVEYLILTQIFDDKALDRLRGIWKEYLPKSGATELDAFIVDNYERLESIGRYQIWKRKQAWPQDTEQGEKDAAA